MNKESIFRPIFKIEIAENEVGFAATCLAFGKEKPWGKMIGYEKDPLEPPDPDFKFRVTESALRQFFELWKKDFS